MSATHQAIPIALLGFSNQSVDVIGNRLSSLNGGRYNIGRPEESKIHIVDIDGMKNNESVNMHIKEHPGTSFVFLSNKNIKRVKYSLRKPLEVNSLDQLLKKITSNVAMEADTKNTQSKAQEVEQDPDVIDSSGKKFSKDPNSQTRHLQHISEHHDDTRFWGVRWNVKSNEKECKTFAWQDYLLGLVYRTYHEAKRLNQPIKIETEQQSLVLLPKMNIAMIDCSNTRLQLACLQKMRRVDSNREDYLLTAYKKSEKHWLEDESLRSEKIDILLWDLALWTSRGRLPNNLNQFRPYKVKRWPNFTRLQTEEYMLCLTAIMSCRAISINDLSNKLKLPHGFICHFISGMLALDLLDTDTHSGDTINPWQEQANKKTNIIANLFKFLSRSR